MKKLTNYLSASFLILSTSTAFAQDLRAESSAAQTAATGAYSRQITDLAGASACTKYSWKNRGRAPAGYVRQIKRADKEAAFHEAVHLAGFTLEEARKFFGEPERAGFDLDRFDQLIRPWPTREAYDRFVAEVESLAAKAAG